MTAVVGILNKQAIAIAADSAVTIGNSNKIFNKANKVFSLSKKHPVGIMIYNSADFMSVPWETIIKMYRRKLRDDSFDTLSEYQQDFIEFIRSKSFFCDESDQQTYLGKIITDLMDECMAKVPESVTSQRDAALFMQELEHVVDDFISESPWGFPICEEFDGYQFEDFETYTNVIFESIFESRFTQNQILVSDDLSNKLKTLAYRFLVHETSLTSISTGLVFVGFGEEEIYPQLIHVLVNIVFDNRLKYKIDKKGGASISNASRASIKPFGQTDVIDTILSGIDVGMENSYTQNIEQILNDYNSLIIGLLGEGNDEIRAQIRSIDNRAIVDTFNDVMFDVKKEKYIFPLFKALSTLSKEDLAEMAESLIYITYLKRRMTDSEESVGGPVDVAVISKGDGLVWIKRKHYFSKELNEHFSTNYL